MTIQQATTLRLVRNHLEEMKDSSEMLSRQNSDLEELFASKRDRYSELVQLLDVNFPTQLSEVGGAK